MASLLDVFARPLETLKALPGNAWLATAGAMDALNHGFGGKSTLAAEVVAYQRGASPEETERLKRLELTNKVVERAVAQTGKDLELSLPRLTWWFVAGAAGVVVVSVGGYILVQRLIRK